MSGNTRKNQVTRLVTLRYQLTMSGVLGLLALSLTALTYNRDLVPPWVAITMAVGGILLLAWTLVAGASFREESEGTALVQRDSNRPD